MAKKKEAVRLQHKTFGEVVIKSSFFTASSNSKFFTALCSDGKTRNLLAESDYWKSDAAEVAKQFNAFSAKALLAEKQKLAADRKRDRNAASAKKIPHDRKMAMERLDEAEIREIEIETDEPEYAEADY
jgi:hypothetical protein